MHTSSYLKECRLEIRKGADLQFSMFELKEIESQSKREGANHKFCRFLTHDSCHTYTMPSFYTKTDITATTAHQILSVQRNVNDYLVASKVNISQKGAPMPFTKS